MKKLKLFAFCAAASALCLLSSCEGQQSQGVRMGIGFTVRSASTKSAPITTESIKQSPYGEFLSEAFENASHEVLYQGATAAYDGEYWPVRNQSWPDDTYQTPLDFWSYAPKSEFGSTALSYSADRRQVSFSYSPYSNAELRQDAANQKDIILACNLNQNRPLLTATQGAVPVTFNHALSAVRFKIGSIDSGFDYPDKIEINSITISGVKGSGICTAQYFTEETLDINWLSDTPVSYIQTFSPTDPVTYASTGMYLDTFGTDATVMGSDVFMLIPQTLSGMTITVNWSMDGLQYTSRTRSVSDGLTLNAGTVYTFTIDMKKVAGQKDVNVALTDILPWNAVAAIVDYSHLVTASEYLSFDPASCVIDEEHKLVTFKDISTPIRCRFKLTSPEGGTFFVRLTRDFDAFRWEYNGSEYVRDPDDPSVQNEFVIYPTVFNPERNYYTYFELVVRSVDGRVIACDDVLNNEHYTIVLQKAI